MLRSFFFFFPIDIAINETFGNLANQSIAQFWKSRIYSRQVIGKISGPPCETWTAVRLLILAIGEGRSPPPLRSSVQPWGLHGITGKQLDQVFIGNQLLGVSLEFTAALAQVGGFAVVEHPDEAYRAPQAASIWRCAFTSWVQAHPAVRHVIFNQGVHGQVGKKPTRLLVLGLDTLEQYIFRRQTPVAWDRQLETRGGPLCGGQGWEVCHGTGQKVHKLKVCCDSPCCL